MTTDTITAIAFAILASAGWLAFAREYRAHRGTKAIGSLMFDLEQDNARVFLDRLTALRRNCYLTDVDGVRRKYSAVSSEVRQKAERSDERGRFVKRERV